MAGGRLHRFEIQKMILLRLLHPPHLARRRTLADLAEDLLAVVVIDVMWQIPAARLAPRPPQFFVNPAFPVIGIEQQDPDFAIPPLRSISILLRINGPRMGHDDPLQHLTRRGNLRAKS